MPKIEIYTTAICPYCVRAKQLLASKNLAYTEIRIDMDREKQAEMLKRTNGARTVPQIFINDSLVGGCDDLFALEKSGRLDDLSR